MKMRIVYLLAFLTFSFSLVSAQTFRQAFDKADYYYNNGNGTSYYCLAAKNSDGSGIPDDDDLMHAYLVMYRATHDKHYIDKFIIHSKRVQERRDDNINKIPVSVIANRTLCNALSQIPGDTNIMGTKSKGWSYDDGLDTNNNKNHCNSWMPSTLYAGKLMHPMAEFVYMMKVEFANNSDLLTSTLPNEAFGINAYINQYGSTYDISEGLTNMQTYADYAAWLEIRLRESVDFFETDYWESGTTGLGCNFGAYSSLAARCLASRTSATNIPSISCIGDINIQCAMAKTLVYMYLYTNPASSYKNLYHDHVVNIASALWCQLQDTGKLAFPSNFNRYQSNEGYWDWCHSFICYKRLVEDVSHGIEEAEFLELCYRYKVTDFNNNDLFSLSTVKAMANTLAYKIYQSPLGFKEYVDGSGLTDNWAALYWGFMIPYNPYLYQALSDKDYYNAVCYPKESALLQTAYLALAQSTYPNSHQNSSYSFPNAIRASNYKFNPIGVRLGHSYNSQCDYLASGDFDNNGLNDFVSVDNANGVFHVYTPDICNDPNLPNNCWVVASSSGHAGNWAGMASADFNSSHAGQELISLNKTTGAIHYFELSGSTFSEQTLTTTVSNWAGIATINGNAAIASDNNGNAYLISVSNGAVNYMSIGSMNNHPISLTSGNFDLNNVNPQIAIADNNSGLISIFEFSNNSLNPLYNNVVTAGTYNIWTGLTAGDLDGDGISELVAHRDYDGQVIIYKLKNGTLTAVYGEYFPIDQLNKAMCTARFKLEESKDALVMFRNFDGQITIYNMDGICPSLHLSNQTIDDNYTINNNYSNTTNDYVVDYHSNNVLTANNFTIAGDGSKVDFKAGNLVYLKKGFNAKAGSDFHASIESGLSCSNVNLRTTNNASTAENPLYSHAIQKLSTLVTVYPNPVNNITNLRVTIPLASKTNIVLYNIVGSKIQSILNSQTLEAGNHEFPVDCSSLSAGIYLIEITTETEQIHKQLIVQR